MMRMNEELGQFVMGKIENSLAGESEIVLEYAKYAYLNRLVIVIDCLIDHQVYEGEAWNVLFELIELIVGKEKNKKKETREEIFMKVRLLVESMMNSFLLISDEERQRVFQVTKKIIPISVSCL